MTERAKPTHTVIPLSCGPGSSVPPPGWKWTKLAELARLESGHTPSRRRPEWWGGSIPWIALPDIRALDGKIAFETAEHINEDGIANSAARVLPPGTVVLSRTASVGFITIMGRPMATSQDFVNWVCGPNLDPHFLALLFAASREYIRSLASGAIHKTVYVPTVESFYVCVPPLSEQKRIVARLTEQALAVQQARAAAEARVEAAKALSSACGRDVFRSSAAEGWPRRRLGNLLARPLKTGISKPLSLTAAKSCLTLSAVRRGVLDLSACKPVAVSDSQAEGNWVTPGAFYVVRGNGKLGLVGRGGLAPAVIDTPVLYPDLLFELVTDASQMDTEYLRWVWDADSVRADIERRARTSAGIYKINGANLADISLPVPERLEEQRRTAATMAERMSNVERVRSGLEIELVQIEGTRAALLRRTFAGEL